MLMIGATMLGTAGCHPRPGHGHGAASLAITVVQTEFDTVSVDGTGRSVVIARAGTYDVEIDGSSNTARIGDGQSIRHLRLEGIGNVVRVGSGCTFASIVIDGIDCELQLPLGASFPISDSGVSTAITYYGPG